MIPCIKVPCRTSSIKMRLLVFTSLLVVTAAIDWDVQTPLDAYVNDIDPNFSYRQINRFSGPGYEIYLLNMTSQRWMDESISTTPLWWHYLSIAIPNTVRFHDAAYLNVGAGNNDDDPPDPVSDPYLNVLGNFSRNTGAVAAWLKMCPNQPLYLAGDPDIPKVEDFIIGHTWRMYIENGSHPNITLQLPMTKAAKAAVDAVAQFAPTVNPALNITRYMPSGYSKRGWVSWLLAASDRRVFATCPIVFDLLNFRENLHHHFRSLGGWSWAFTPYWVENVPQYIDHPKTSELAWYVAIDALTYNERLTMPKMIIIAAGDQFFLPDDSHYFWDQLTPPKQMLLIEDTEHGMRGKRHIVDRNIEAFFIASLTGWTYPSQTWLRNETQTSGSISLQTDTLPLDIKAWLGDSNNTHYNPPIRDFREEALNAPNLIRWQDYEVQDMGNNQYYINFNKRPDAGWRGFFITAQYEGPEGRTVDLTSEINIIPDTMPYPRCTTRQECDGDIV